MKNTFTAGISLLLLYGSQFIHAQQPLQEIVVTANRFEQYADTANAAISVVTREEIERSMAQNLNDLLNGKTGLHIAQSGGQGGQSSLFLRGTESDHTLVLIDGVQMATSTGTAARVEYIGLDQIERIEIVRGPRSSIYGSDAIGGVLQIFTRQGQRESFTGTVDLMTGTENSNNANLNLSGGWQDSDWSVSYSNRETDGIDARKGGDDDRDGFNNDSYAVSFSHQFADNSRYSLNYSEIDADSDFDDGMVASNSKHIANSLALQLSDVWESTLSMELFSEENTNAGSFGDTFSETDTRAIRWRNDLVLSELNRLSVGVDVKQEKLDYLTFGAEQSDDTRDNKGIYGVYLFNPAPFDVTLSLRNDDNEHFGSHTTGSASIGREFKGNTRLWLSYGTAYKAPNLIDLYVDFPSFFFFANPGLEPETSKSLELGLISEVLGGFATLNIFQSDIEDLITSDASFTTLANIEEAEIKGVELSYSKTILNWALDFNLTLLRHENKNTGEDLRRRPEQSFSLAASRQLGDWDLAINWLAQSDHADVDFDTFGPSQVGGYGIVDLVGGYQVSEKIALRLRIGNVLDKNYQIVDGFNSYGRTAQFSVNVGF